MDSIFVTKGKWTLEQSVNKDGGTSNVVLYDNGKKAIEMQGCARVLTKKELEELLPYAIMAGENRPQDGSIHVIDTKR